jgi:hypothetical protein
LLVVSERESLTVRQSILITLAALLAASACAYAPPRPLPPPQAPAAPHAPTPESTAVHTLVTANPDAAQILRAIRDRGLAFAPSDVSRVDLLAGSPGYAWSVGRDWLHLHVYRDRAAAAAGAQRFAATAMARSQIIDWVGKPHLFQCGTVVALYLGEAPQALNVITSLCGPPVWMR